MTIETEATTTPGDEHTQVCGEILAEMRRIADLQRSRLAIDEQLVERGVTLAELIRRRNALEAPLIGRQPRARGSAAATSANGVSARRPGRRPRTGA